MVATSDFSGLVSSAWALARAPARLAIDSLDRCIASLRATQDVKAHCTRFRALGPNAVADGLLGIFRHQAFEFGLGLLVLKMSGSGPGKDTGEFRPCI